MRVQSIAIISVLATVSLANAAAAKEYQRVWTSQNNGADRPTVYVTLGDLDPQIQFFLTEIKLEWTANGQPMPSNLSGKAECISESSQAYSCEALMQWFTGPAASGGRPGRNWARNGYPEGFQLRNMEFNTDYCFRFKVGGADWGFPRCARTPSPPPPLPKPFAPSKPELTLLPAESGSWRAADDLPWRILVKWNPNPSNQNIAQESVEVSSFDDGLWQPTDGGSPGGTLVPLSRGYDPDTILSVRVCAKNMSGEACSPPTRTSGRPWLEKVPDGGKASRFPKPEGGSDTYDPTTPALATGPTVRRQDRVRPGGVDLLPGPSRSMCELAQVASARNSPAAPGLQANCVAEQEANRLAVKGEQLAGQDPLAMELRDDQPGDSARRGFDIGMGAAEGHTAPGPGKQATQAKLPLAEQRGFAIAVAFSLERNKNAALAAAGARIAMEDQAVGTVRNATADPFYRLGFDIATGIFGDPTRGAQGNTATGPGSMAIRNGLGEAGRRGFDAAGALLLGPDYKP